MKKMMTGSIIAMSLGAGMMAYALTNNKTKNKTDKSINNAMDFVNEKLEKMK